jgi:hypothetical protein
MPAKESKTTTETRLCKTIRKRTEAHLEPAVPVEVNTPAAPAIAVKVPPLNTAVRVRIIAAKAIRAANLRGVNGTNRADLNAAAKPGTIAAKVTKDPVPKVTNATSRAILKAGTKAAIPAVTNRQALTVRIGLKIVPKVAIIAAKVMRAGAPNIQIVTSRATLNVGIKAIPAAKALSDGTKVIRNKLDTKMRAAITAIKASRAVVPMKAGTTKAVINVNPIAVSVNGIMNREMITKAKAEILKVTMTKVISAAKAGNPLSMATRNGTNAASSKAVQTMTKRTIPAHVVHVSGKTQTPVGNV